jgi:hypothetical protein
MDEVTDALADALTAAREAHAAASEALRRAEAAAGAAGAEVDASVVDELTVKRINVVEDDGTLRMVIGTPVTPRCYLSGAG